LSIGAQQEWHEFHSLDEVSCLPVHEERDASTVKPDPQGKQLPELRFGWYCRLGQLLQNVLPAALKLPATYPQVTNPNTQHPASLPEHTAQEPELAVENLPASHCEQAVALAKEKDPAWQTSHATAASSDWKVPALQMAHELPDKMAPLPQVMQPV
jgi:hypothetical protein